MAKDFIQLENEIDELLSKGLGRNLKVIRTYEVPGAKDECSSIYILFSQEITKNMLSYSVVAIGDFLDENELTFSFYTLKEDKLKEIEEELLAENDMDAALCFSDHIDKYDLGVKDAYVFYKTFIDAGYVKL